MNRQDKLSALVSELRECRLCPGMIPPPIPGTPVPSPVMLVGQAPGSREGDLGRPFAWTAGRTLFTWFSSIGIDEEHFRSFAYIAAVCRCFPGKTKTGGDRVPSRTEIETCSHWLDAELDLVRPGLLLPVGKLAISRFLAVGKLVEVIGKQFEIEQDDSSVTIIPLPHPSGASTWHRSEPGKTLLANALDLVSRHPAWKELTDLVY
jgi:uracil-DNA glycosylase